MIPLEQCIDGLRRAPRNESIRSTLSDCRARSARQSEGLKEGSENPLTFANVQMAQRIMRESILATGCLHGYLHAPKSGFCLAKGYPEFLVTNGLQLVDLSGQLSNLCELLAELVV